MDIFSWLLKIYALRAADSEDSLQILLSSAVPYGGTLLHTCSPGVLVRGLSPAVCGAGSITDAP